MDELFRMVTSVREGGEYPVYVFVSEEGGSVGGIVDLLSLEGGGAELVEYYVWCEEGRCEVLDAYPCVEARDRLVGLCVASRLKACKEAPSDEYSRVARRCVEIVDKYLMSGDVSRLLNKLGPVPLLYEDPKKTRGLVKVVAEDGRYVVYVESRGAERRCAEFDDPFIAMCAAVVAGFDACDKKKLGEATRTCAGIVRPGGLR